MALYEILCLDHVIGYLDGKLYYQYLPEWFIEKNFSFYVKYPFGTALLESPFFIVAHLLTKLINPTNATGYGGLYEYAVGFAGIFYFVFGSVLIYKTLVVIEDTHQGEGKENRAAFITIVLLTLGTFLPYYATRYAAFSHIYTYFAASLFIYLTVKIKSGEKPGLSFLLGITAGLLFLIRNVNIVFVFFYLLTDIKDVKSKLKPKRLLFNVLGGLLVVIPQFIYWKRTTGHFILNTYSDESFSYLLRPKFYEIFLSDAKGILILSPILIFSFLGFFYIFKKEAPERPYAVAALFLTVIELYLTAAWWCWWLGGVYGVRAVIDIFPIMAIPLNAFIKTILYKRDEGEAPDSQKAFKPAKIIFIILCILFVYANLAFLLAAERGLLNETFTTWYELKRAFFLQG
ncbi:MAG: hypothetical protein IIZ61_08190 [Lachnospiraceae bacterium]|nr:hypothetical protein [Lachnospiraceae bacterium]